MNGNDFPAVKNVIRKRTKNGQRFLLHGHDLAGKDVYITIPIKETDGTKEYFKKIEQAKIKLNEKILGDSFRSILNQYFTYKQFTEATRRASLFLANFCMDDKKNQKMVEEILDSEDFKLSTKRLYISKINSFFNWLRDVKHLNVNNPAQYIVIKGKFGHRTRCITDEELERLFDLLRRRKNQELELVVRIAFFTGARISSIYKLKPESLRDGKLYFRNVKCKKEYDYPIPLNDEETIMLFKMVSRKGFLWSSQLATINVMVNKIMLDEFGRDQKGETLSIHSLRHSFATRAIQKGVPPEIVAKLLDHSSINTTLTFYAKHSQQQIDDAIDKIFKE